MARTNYQRGYEIERKIMEELTKEGFLVMRSAGSHSKIDVLGISKKKIVAIQAKRTKKFSWSAYLGEVAAIQEIMKQYDLDLVMDWELWVWVDRQGFWKWRISLDGVKEVLTDAV